MKIENFKEKLTARCEKEYNAQPKELTPEQLHCAVSGLVMEELSPAWEKSRAAHDKARKASYLSMEFLVGRAVYNNLLCLDLLDSTAEGLKELGADINEFEEIEDAALGNGGLGRLAACSAFRLTATEYATSTDCSSRVSRMASRRRPPTTGSARATRGAFGASRRKLLSTLLTAM